MLGGYSEFDNFEEQNRQHCGSQGGFLFFKMSDDVGCLCADGNYSLQG